MFDTSNPVTPEVTVLLCLIIVVCMAIAAWLERKGPPLA